MNQNKAPAPVGRTRWRRFLAALGAGIVGLALVGVMAASGVVPYSLAFSGIPFFLRADTLDGQNFVQYAMPDRIVTGESGAKLIGGGANRVLHSPVGCDSRGNNCRFGPGDLPSGAPKNAIPAAGQGPNGEDAWFASDTVSQIRAATIGGLNQTVCAPIPFFTGDVWMSVHTLALGDTNAQNLTIQAPALTAGTASFWNIMIGTPLGAAMQRKGFLDHPDQFTDPYGVAHSPTLQANFAQEADRVHLAGINQLGVGTEAGWFNINGLKLWANFGDDCGFHG